MYLCGSGGLAPGRCLAQAGDPEAGETESEQAERRRFRNVLHEACLQRRIAGENEADRVATIEDGQRILAASNVSLTAQMAETTMTVQGALHAIQALTATLQDNNETALNALVIAKDERAELRAALHDNTRATQKTLETAEAGLQAAKQVHDVVVTATVLGRVVQWSIPIVGGLAAALAVTSGVAKSFGGWLARLFSIG